MRRLLAAGSLAAVVAFGAACSSNGNDNDDTAAGEQATQPAAGNTAQVCQSAQEAQAQEVEQFNEDMAAMQEELPEEELEEAAVARMEEALVGWSDGLREQAELADDPELAEALTGLADGLADAAPQVTPESVQNGEIPGAEELEGHSQTVADICAPAATPTP